MEKKLPTIEIIEKYCKGCHICVEFCPTKVLGNAGLCRSGQEPGSLHQMHAVRTPVPRLRNQSNSLIIQQEVMKVAKKVAFLQGNEAAAHGALYAGCNFFAGYPDHPLDRGC